jgi:hypothetical protein
MNPAGFLSRYHQEIQARVGANINAPLCVRVHHIRFERWISMDDQRNELRTQKPYFQVPKIL